jgi:hypothetical protein
METEEIGFDYDAELEGGVVDGRKLAGQMMVDAWRLLIPYAKDCPACAWKMFGGLSTDAIGSAEGEWEQRGKIPSIRFWRKGIEDRYAAFEAHRIRTEEITKGLLARAGGEHECGG